MQKWASMHVKTGGPFCNDETNERGLRFMARVTFNDLVLYITKHTENGPDAVQVDNTTTKLIII